MNDGGVSEVLDAARSYADAGNLLLAAEKFNEAVIVYPTNATAWYGLGVVQANRGMTNEAIDAFENSHSISPGHGATAANLAVLLESSNPKRASKMARMAVKIVGDVDELVRISRLFDHTEAQEEVMLEAAPVEEEVMLEAAPVEEEVMLEAAPVEEEVMLGRSGRGGGIYPVNSFYDPE